jgi:predicted alpha/beta hydrolase family esterase
LVAPAETRGSERIGPFGPIPETPLRVPATVVASRNDPWMRFARSKLLSQAWGADLVDLGFAGHINVASGYGPWVGGKWLRDDLLRKTFPRPAAEITSRRIPA